MPSVVALVSWLARHLAALFIAAYACAAALLVQPLHAHERVHTPASSRASSAAELDALDAEPDMRPVVSFGGCGFLSPYQLGAAAYIAERFDTSAMRCAGHSAGFASALTLAAGVPPEVHWEVLCAARRRWATRLLGPFLDHTRAWMAPYVDALAPYESAVVAAAADGRLALGYTRLVVTRRWPPLRAGHALAAGFDSLKGFVHAVTVSQRCPPFYRSPGYIHGAWGLDGAFSAQFTTLGQRQPATVSPTNPLADVAPRVPLPPHWFLTLPDAGRWAKLHQARGDAAGALTCV